MPPKFARYCHQDVSSVYSSGTEYSLAGREVEDKIFKA